MKRYRNKEWLMHQYIDKKLSTLKIAELENVHRDTILYNLKLFNIPRRSLSDAFKLRTMTEEQRHAQSERKTGSKLPKEACKRISIGKMGDKNPNWRGGLSFGKYCPKFNRAFKNKIRKKFDNRCFICGKLESDNSTKLCVHHIDYNKNSICNGKDWAFVPLCRSCHSKTAFNRYYYFNLLINYWAIDYSAILETL